MAFLHSVLKDIRDNENLSPYKFALNTAVDELHGQLNNGKAGLRDVIDSVKEGIRDWLGEVELKNKNVSGSIHTLNELIDAPKNVIDGMIKNAEYNFDAKIKLAEWIADITVFQKYSGFASDGLKYLDNNLRTQLYPHVSLIKDRVDTFVDSTKKDHEGLVKVCEKVDKEVKKITDYADLVIKNAAGDIASKFMKIEKHLKDARENSNALDNAYRYAKKKLMELKRTAEAVLQTAKDNTWQVSVLDAKIQGVLNPSVYRVWEKLMAVDINIIQDQLSRLVSGITQAIAKLSEVLESGNIEKVESLINKFYRADFRNLKNLVDMAKLDYEEAVSKTTPPIKSVHQPPASPPKSNAEQAADAAASLETKLNKALGIEPSTTKRVVVPKGAKQEKSLAGKVDEAIKRVKDKVDGLQSEFDANYNPLKSGVDALRSTMESVIAVSKQIANADSGVPNDINKIEEKITDLQREFRDVLTAVRDAKLTHHISEIWSAVNAAKEQIAKYIIDAARHFKSLATTAQTQIKRQALSKFAQSKARALEQLKQLVEDEKEKIEYLISLDKMAGLKGFMKIFKEKFVPEVGSMNSIIQGSTGTPSGNNQNKSKLSHATDKLYGGFYALFEEVAKVGEELQRHADVIRPDALFPEPSIYGKLYDPLKIVLQDINDSEHFDHNFSDHLKSLNNALSTFSPAKFTDSSSPILQALKDGIDALAKQLGYAYVSAYCCKKFDGALVDPQDPPKTSDDKRKLTEYGKKLSKVFMTCLPGWGKHLDWLRRHCDKDPKGPWNGLQITKLKNNPLGLWFDSRGYKVSDSEKPEGELNIIQDPKHGIHGLLVDNREIEKRLYRNDDEKKDPGTLREVCKYLPLYFQVRHHEHFDSPKPPTTVSHMLQWITGLTYNPMLEKLDSHFTTMFQGLKKAYRLDNPHIAITKPFRLNLGANENIVGSGHLSAVLRRVCKTAETVLIALQGHGHAAGRYACEYSSNVDKLDYTTSPSKCFDLLCEICLKLHDQLNFLYRHCSHPSKLGGWQDCWYGNGVAGTSWQCNNLQCPDQPYNQEGNQKHNQQCDQNCNQNADCGLKSPLQSYLEDGLPGFIPHHLKKLGCGVECSLGKHRGLPCLIPMGFSEIGTVASHRQKGEDLKKVLEKFCGQPSKPLTLFCSYVKCLLHIPPQTLGDMFAFYYGFLNGWDGSGPNRKVAFEQAVQNADFENRNTTLNVGTMFQSSDHTGTSTTHVKGDLCSLVTCDGGIATLDPVGTCGPYLRPLCMDNRGIYSSTFKNYYLSWIVYATETFSRLLKDLLEECRQSCGLPKSKCHTTNCVTNCRTVVSDITSPNKNHQQGCKSIVKCKSTLPNLYKYGFYFGNTQKLNGTEDIRTKRTCNDFCDALDRVLSEVKDKNDVLAKLIYETIPKFLWDIRSKFYYLLLALWSLSLLYLLHIAVVRLDVLRIRSHLRSPSSHRIAAQSLLAAARVKALANVKGKALDDLAERRISLGQLAGQLSGFIGKSDAVTDAINNAINIIIDSNEDFKSLKIPSSSTVHPPAAVPAELINDGELRKKIEHYEDKIASLEASQKANKDAFSEKDSRLLSSHQSKLDALQRLKSLNDSLSSLKSPQDKPCETLLNNLCSGLEKFLGYQETSKGYDGTGIVYSDLDRLCDGVMSFLHGVLESVKDDDSVTTYDNDHTLKVSNVISILHNALGKGPEDFKTSMDMVSDWLVKYFAQVTKYTENITGQLGELKNNIIPITISSVSGSATKPLKEQLDDWTQAVQIIETHINDNLINNVHNLDKSLKHSLRSEIEAIKASVKMFHDSAKKQLLVEQVQRVGRELKWHEDYVLTKIRSGSQVLQDKLEQEFTKMGIDIRSVNETREAQVTNLQCLTADARKKAQQLVDAFDTTYKQEIENKLLDIELKLANLDKNKNGGENSFLKAQIVALTSAAEAMDKACKAKLTELCKDVKKNVLSANRTRAQLIRQADEKVSTAYMKLTELIKGSTEGLMESLTSAWTAFEEINKGVLGVSNDDYTKSIRHNWDTLKEKIKALVGDINSDGKGLIQFYQGVEAYVGLFTQSSFGKKILEEWINEIVDKDPVKGHIGLYLTDNHGMFNVGYATGGDTGDFSKVSKEVKQKILLGLKTSFPTTQVRTHQNVEEKLTGVSSFLNAFATQVIKQETSIVKAIDDVVVNQQKKRISPYYQSELQIAIHETLASLSSIAKQVAGQVEKFRSTSHIKNVYTAIGHVHRMKGEIANEPGSLIDTALTNLNGKFNKLYGILELTHGTLTAKVKNLNNITTAKEVSGMSNFAVDGENKICNSIEKIEQKFNQEFENGNNEIQTQHIPAYVDTEGRYTAAKGEIDTVIDDQVEKLPGLLDTARNTAKQKMDALKEEIEKIRNAIYPIEEAVESADKHMTALIVAVQKTLSAAKSALTNAITKFQLELSTVVTTAFASVTTEVQTMFAYQKIADLEALKTLVENQLKKVEHIIQRDKRMGIKGFLKAVNGVKLIVKPNEYPRFDASSQHNLLDHVKQAVPAQSLKTKPTEEDFKKLSTQFQDYSTNIHKYIQHQLNSSSTDVQPQPHVPPPISGGGYRARPAAATVNPKNNTDEVPPGRVGVAPKITSQPSPPTNQASPSPSAKNPLEKFFEDLKLHVERLFGTLSMGRFSNQSATNRDAFTSFLNSMRPEKFAQLSSPLLDVLKSGLQDFLGELGKAYVNVYEGHPYKVDFSREADGKNCAKAFLTLLNTLQDDLTTLKQRCDHPSPKSKIDLSTGLGELFESYGYVVSKRDKQNGELRNEDNCRGSTVSDKLNEQIEKAPNNPHLQQCKPNGKAQNFNVMDILLCLTSHLTTYNEVCHLGTFSAKRSPCSVYEMLAWCYGLQYNGVYNKMKLHYQAFLKKQQEMEEKERSEGKTKETEEKKDIYLRGVMGKLAKHGLPDLSRNSRNILTTVLGTGDAFTMYASDLANNSINLKYPTSGEECLHTLLDILRKLFPPLRYLQTRCQINTKHSGWRECKYGKNIPTTKSQCSDYVSGKANCQPKCEPNCQATLRPTDEPNCQPTSPLMSYLNDCLPGHLPHQLSSVGCASVCLTCPKAVKGMPCLTPLGFRSFSGSTKTGRDICKILSTFFDDAELRSVLCLVAKPPSTLPEHFGFVLSLVNDWHNARRHSIKDSLETSVKDRSISLYENPSKFTDALRDIFNSKHSTHPDKNHLPQYADVSSLAMPTPCTVADVRCAPYLYTLCTDQYSNLATTHSDAYLSWAVYLPWTFWNYLECLYNAFKEIFCQDWGCRTCLHGKCKRGQHGLNDEESKQPHCQCGSMVQCKGVSSTLYQCGFTFGDALTLNDEKSPKQCSDFCTQLRNVLDSEYFKDLFRECDNFLCAIRWPFMLTLLALWSLSLLYLLHIAVVRLDVLRIRSHLRSPSSHRIAAQSLLAAARVKALANVKGKALDDIDARRISLGKLAGQLSGFIGGGEEVTEAIRSGIDIIINKYPEVKSNSKPSSPKPHDLVESTTLSKEIKSIEEKKTQLENEIAEHKRQQKDSPVEPSKLKSLDELTSKLKSLHSLQELEQYSQKLDTHKNNTQNLLKNLTEGLEKFLGFNPTSKGYDGTGIVYSELDRLCDGVMSFLHGVLNEVHTNNNLSPYKEKLKDAVINLNKQLNNGKTGLRDVIGSVKEGIGQWLGDVKTKNDEVSRHINELLKHDHIPMILKCIEGLKSTDYNNFAVSTLRKWMDAVEKIPNYSSRSFINLDYIDQNLQKALSPHVSLIKDRVDTFVDSTKQDHEGLKKVCGKVDEEFGELDKKVEEGIEGDQGLKKKLKEGVKKIVEQVEKERKGDLYKSIDQARRGLMEARQTASEGFDKHNSGLQHKINEAFEALKREVEKCQSSFSRKKEELDLLIGDARGAFCDLKTKSVIAGGEKEKCMEHNWYKLKERITEVVEEINGYPGSGLIQIFYGIQKYAKDFNTKFEKDVEKMVQGIVDSEGIKQLLGYYVGDNQSSNRALKKEKDVIKAIKEYFQQMFKRLVKESIEKVNVSNTTDVSQLPNKFQTLSLTIAKDLASALDVDNIVNTISRMVTTDGTTTSTNDHLKYAVDIIISATTSLAKNLAEELKALIEKSHISNLQTAINKFRDFGTIFGQPDQPGHKITNAFDVVIGKISELDRLFDQNGAAGSVKSKIKELEENIQSLNKLQVKGSDGSIEAHKESVTKELAQLKKEIDEDIKAVIDMLGTAPLQLKKLLNEIEKSLTKFQQKFLEAITEFHAAYIKQSTTAATSIKKSALSQFAQSKAHALGKLKELVEDESAKIEYLISLDNMSGLKGFMKIFNDKFVPEVGSMNSIIQGSTGTPSGNNQNKSKLSHATDKLYGGFYALFEEVGNVGAELKQHSNVIRPDALFPEPSIYGKLYDPLKIVLQDINDSEHFDHAFSTNLKSLNNALSTFTPAKFTDSSSPILQALKDGIDALAKQLGYAYVSTYCCQKFDGALLDPDTSLTDDKRKLTEYGKKLSKVFMTCIPGWARYLYDLQQKCSGEWSKKQIHTPDDSNKMALWFHSRGYNVSDSDKIQNGHLRRNMTGEQIKTKLVEHKLDASKIKIKIKNSNNQITLIDILNLCHYFLEKYNRVSHYYTPPKPRAPSNIYLMLQWTAGLKYNHMYSEVKSQLGNVLKGLQKEYKLEEAELPVAVPYDMQRVIQSPIDSAQLTKALESVCSYSEKTLVAVLGHGHADGVYASDHLTNSSNLLYPGSGGACFDMLVDVLFRLYKQLWFLCKQCLDGKSHSGWRECSYGRHVAGSGWQCNEEQCANLECPQKVKQIGDQTADLSADQRAKQSADQRCGQHPDCGMKSPLQSFLEDGLQGFLPHSFNSPGCKLTCSVSNHRGLPCKTPMGFADIGIAASHTKTGEHLKEALNNFCGPYSALTRLCNMLNCVLRRAPQTLDDIFGFLRGYLANWIDARDHKISAFNAAVRDAYFGKEYPFDPTSISYTRNHSHHMQTHSKGDLFTISECEDRAVDTCGVYVESLSYNLYSIFSSYHNKQYLSWILYSAETLYNLLDRLYKQCCNNCTSPGAKCHGTRCADKCQVKQAYDAQTSDDADAASKSLDGKNHTENCASIVKCHNTLPTLYMYGFSFGKPLGLCGTGDAMAARRTCKDFCSALKKILEEESALIQLIKQIDEFIWKIREKFSITLLALWSLSLLYLLHITIVRLDVLRIRSHLRSPSSHRIAAQSLLAVAKVGKIANVKYFSP
ncbi:hypothetical protein, conserved [Babesia ovata]|uniref:C3H1-type domain-containing protein n=1 Tax=Babesia ovata TaxID=189622 RepID=A0A2H6KJD1_9APIC|nr:uncharacterized protein BOVATA_045900 [Babesia ovata]GBE63097.1 hypothetical protein, conserved [Babesia ovata]